MARPVSSVVFFVRLALKAALPLLLTVVLAAEIHEYSRLITPIVRQADVAQAPTVATPVGAVAPDDYDVEESLRTLGAPRKKIRPLAEAVRYAAKVTNLPKDLIVALIYTESAFKENAVSPKQYKGLMQIPHEVPYADANVIVGARILEDKVRLAGGDIEAALAMYKGGADNAQARRQAAHTLGVYERLRQRKPGRKQQ